MTQKHGAFSGWRIALLAAPLLVVTLLVSGLFLARTAHASASTFTVSSTFPISIAVFVPCAQGGAGDVVFLSGNLHDLFSITFDSAGGVRVKFQDNPQGVSGTALSSGVKYQGTGITEQSFQAPASSSFTFTFVNNFRIIGQGPDNNFMVHENTHVTFDANGNLTAFVDNFSITCQ